MPHRSGSLRVALSAFAFISFALTPGCLAADSGVVPKCYYPNGSLASRDYACILNTTHSFCCAAGFACLPNKMCLSITEDPSNSHAWNRGSCTDDTWASPECAQLCQGVDADAGTYVTQCETGDNSASVTKVCCGGNSTCCNDKTKVFLLAGESKPYRTIDSSAATSTLSVQSQTASSSACPTAASVGSSKGGTLEQQPKKESMSVGEKVGIAVGAVVGALILAVGGFFIGRTLGSAKKSKPQIAELSAYNYAAREPEKPPVEAPGESIVELGAGHGIYQSTGYARHS